MPLGALNTAINLAISAVMLLLLGFFLMDLMNMSALVRPAAVSDCSGSFSYSCNLITGRGRDLPSATARTLGGSTAAGTLTFELGRVQHRRL